MPSHNYAYRNHYLDDAKTGLDAAGESSEEWHVIWTHSNCERMVSDLLEAKGYRVFLPLIEEWRPTLKASSDKAIRLASKPMFPGYLFIKHCIDRTAFLDISNTKGVAHLLGLRWNALATIPDEEVSSIQRLVESQLPLMPHPFLQKGEKVLITRGTLANTSGILLEKDNKNGVFIVSISLLKSSVAVNIDSSDLIPL